MALSLFFAHALVRLAVIFDRHELSVLSIALLPVAIVALKMTSALHRGDAVPVAFRRIGRHDSFLSEVVIVEAGREALASFDEAIVGRSRVRVVRIAVLAIGRRFRASLARPEGSFRYSVHIVTS